MGVVDDHLFVAGNLTDAILNTETRGKYRNKYEEADCLLVHFVTHRRQRAEENLRKGVALIIFILAALDGHVVNTAERVAHAARFRHQSLQLAKDQRSASLPYPIPVVPDSFSTWVRSCSESPSWRRGTKSSTVVCAYVGRRIPRRDYAPEMGISMTAGRRYVPAVHQSTLEKWKYVEKSKIRVVKIKDQTNLSDQARQTNPVHKGSFGARVGPRSAFRNLRRIRSIPKEQHGTQRVPHSICSLTSYISRSIPGERSGTEALAWLLH